MRMGTLEALLAVAGYFSPSLTHHFITRLKSTYYSVNFFGVALQRCNSLIFLYSNDHFFYLTRACTDIESPIDFEFSRLGTSGFSYMQGMSVRTLESDRNPTLTGKGFSQGTPTITNTLCPQILAG